jgi:hypothetical protein
MVKLGNLFSVFKTWSNFRLMLVIGSAVTILSLALGAIVVQAALSDDPDSDNTPATAAVQEREGGEPAEEAEVSGPDAPGTSGAQQTQADRLPVLDGSADFRVSCLAGEAAQLQNTCEVESFGGFRDRVNLSCADLPPGLNCSFVPASVVPRPNGSTPFRIELTAGALPPGSYDFDVVGRSGTKIRSTRYPWRIAAPNVAVAQPAAPRPPGAPPAPVAPAAPLPPAAPTFSFTCGSLTEGKKLLWSLSKDGPNVKINCFLTPLNGFNEPVTFSFSQAADFAKPDTVNFVLEQLQVKKLFDVNFELSDAVRNTNAEQLKTGVDYVFDVTGTSASGKSLTRQVTVTVKE